MNGAMREGATEVVPRFIVRNVTKYGAISRARTTPSRALEVRHRRVRIGAMIRLRRMSNKSGACLTEIMLNIMCC